LQKLVEPAEVQPKPVPEQESRPPADRLGRRNATKVESRALHLLEKLGMQAVERLRDTRGEEDIGRDNVLPKTRMMSFVTTVLEGAGCPCSSIIVSSKPL
jgi:hypothetical protein